MRLTLIRFDSAADDTIGLLLIDGETACFTLEDEARTVKVWGETRIPAGLYRIDLKTWGGFHERYTKRFPEFHRGMLWLRNVPNFEGILIHIGNTDDDTAGCILVGDSADLHGRRLINSTSAYRRIYPGIAAAAAAGSLDIGIEDRS